MFLLREAKNEKMCRWQILNSVIYQSTSMKASHAYDFKLVNDNNIKDELCAFLADFGGVITCDKTDFHRREKHPARTEDNLVLFWPGTRSEERDSNRRLSFSFLQKRDSDGRVPGLPSVPRNSVLADEICRIIFAAFVDRRRTSTGGKAHRVGAARKRLDKQRYVMLKSVTPDFTIFKVNESVYPQSAIESSSESSDSSPEPERKSIKRGRAEELFHEKPLQKSAAKAPKSAKVPDLPERLKPAEDWTCGFLIGIMRAICPRSPEELSKLALEMRPKMIAFLESWEYDTESINSSTWTLDIEEIESIIRDIVMPRCAKFEPRDVQLFGAPTQEHITSFMISLARTLFPNSADAEAAIVASQLSRKVPPYTNWPSFLVSLQSVMPEILNNPFQCNEAFAKEVDAAARAKFLRDDPTVREQAKNELKAKLAPAAQEIADKVANERRAKMAEEADKEKAQMLKDHEAEKAKMNKEHEAVKAVLKKKLGDETIKMNKDHEVEKAMLKKKLGDEKIKMNKDHEAEKAKLKKELEDEKWTKMQSLDEVIAQKKRETDESLAKKLNDYNSQFDKPEAKKELERRAVQRLIENERDRLDKLAVDELLVNDKGESLHRKAQSEAARAAFLANTNAVADSALIEKEKNEFASFFSEFYK